MGVFAVTAGIGVEKKEKYFLDDLDDYSAIMLKALADRLAEAFAEALHERVRKDLWGYAPQESLSTEDARSPRSTAASGRRRAIPACPDHSVKRDMFELLQAQDIGMELTESLAMMPAASVSGFYLGHPDSTYFNVGKIGEDQLQDQARRRGADVAATAAPAGAEPLGGLRRSKRPKVGLILRSPPRAADRGPSRRWSRLAPWPPGPTACRLGCALPSSPPTRSTAQPGCGATPAACA